MIGDGPTLTHGGMTFGAGWLFVRRHGGAIVDPRPHLVGALRDTLAAYPHVANEVPADVVVDGSPADLGRVLRLDKPLVRVRYELDHEAVARLGELVGGAGGP